MQVLIRAVTFDLWNTLIENRDYTDLRISRLATALEKVGYSFIRNELTEAFAASQTYVYKVWENENHRFVPNKERLEYILQKLSAQLPENLKQDVITYFEEIALSDPPLLIKGTKDILESLRSKYKMGVISDSGFTPARVLRKILLKNGILDLFDITVFSDETGFNKPHKSMFEKVLSNLSVKPSEALHVGDLLQTDVAGAKALGMKAVWLNKEGQNPAEAYKPDFTIKKIREIVDVLGSLS